MINVIVETAANGQRQVSSADEWLAKVRAYDMIDVMEVDAHRLPSWARPVREAGCRDKYRCLRCHKPLRKTWAWLNRWVYTALEARQTWRARALLEAVHNLAEQVASEPCTSPQPCRAWWA